MRKFDRSAALQIHLQLRGMHMPHAWGLSAESLHLPALSVLSRGLSRIIAFWNGTLPGFDETARDDA